MVSVAPPEPVMLAMYAPVQYGLVGTLNVNSAVHIDGLEAF